MASGQPRRVAVIGAGVIGLSTAVCIQKSVPDVHVTVIADRFEGDTVSDGAPAMFIPSLTSLANFTPELYGRICRGSADWFHQRVYAEDAAESGIFLSSGYSLGGKDLEEDPSYKDYVAGCRRLSKEELAKIPGNHENGFFITTYMIDTRRYLVYLLKLFEENGGSVVKHKVDNLDKLSRFEAVVFCTGLESREILKDNDMVPMRGQAMRVNAPWLKHFYTSGIFILPCYDNLFIGATTQMNDSNMEPSDKDRDEMWDAAVKYVPGLKKEMILHDWVGLRPVRTSGLRLEQGTIQSNVGQIKAVYNYGHGRNGVGLSWGSAKIAADLVNDTLSASAAKL